MEKRAILGFILQNPTVSGKKLEFTMRKPFDTVLELATCPTGLRGQDSNLEPSPYTLSTTCVMGWTISSPCLFQDLGALVSSLYGAPLKFCFAKFWRVPTVLPTKGFTVIPKSFNPPFGKKAAICFTGSRSTIELPRNYKILLI